MAVQINAGQTAERLSVHLQTVVDAVVAYVAVVDAAGDEAATRVILRAAVNAAVATDPIAAPA